MIPAAIERNYPKRLLTAGWWHMSLFQQPARNLWEPAIRPPFEVSVTQGLVQTQDQH